MLTRGIFIKNPIEFSSIGFFSVNVKNPDQRSEVLLNRLAERGFQPDGTVRRTVAYMIFLISSVRAGTTLNRSSTIP